MRAQTLIKALQNLQRYNCSTIGSSRIYEDKSNKGKYVRWDSIIPIISLLEGEVDIEMATDYMTKEIRDEAEI